MIIHIEHTIGINKFMLGFKTDDPKLIIKLGKLKSIRIILSVGRGIVGLPYLYIF